MLTLVEEEEEERDEDEGEEQRVEDTESSLDEVVNEVEQADCQASYVEGEEGEDDELPVGCDFGGDIVDDAYERRVVIVGPLDFMSLIKRGCHLVFHLSATDYNPLVGLSTIPATEPTHLDSP